MGGTALGASGRSNNGLKLDVKTGKLSLWRLYPTFTFTFYWPWCRSAPRQRGMLVADRAVPCQPAGRGWQGAARLAGARAAMGPDHQRTLRCTASCYSHRPPTPMRLPLVQMAEVGKAEWYVHTFYQGPVLLVKRGPLERDAPPVPIVILARQLAGDHSAPTLYICKPQIT